MIHRIVLPDGSIRYVHELAEATLDDDGQLVKLTGTVQDITELRTTQLQLEKQRKLLDMLHHSTTDFVEKADFVGTMSKMLQTLLSLTRSEYGFAGEVVYDDKRQPSIRAHAISNIAWSNEEQAQHDQRVNMGFEFTDMQTLFGEVLQRKSVIMHNPAAGKTNETGMPDGHPQIQSYLAVPVFYGDELVGLYALANRKGGYGQKQRDFYGHLIPPTV